MSYGSSRTCGQPFSSADVGRPPQGGPACGPSPAPDEPPGPGASSCPPRPPSLPFRRSRFQPKPKPGALSASLPPSQGTCHLLPSRGFFSSARSPQRAATAAGCRRVSVRAPPRSSVWGIPVLAAAGCPSLATFPAVNGGIFAPAPPSSARQHFRPTLSPLPPAPRARCPPRKMPWSSRGSPTAPHRTAPSLPAGLASPRQCPGVSQKVRQTRSCPGLARVSSQTRFHSRCRPGTF